MIQRQDCSWASYKLLLGNFSWAFDHLISRIPEITEDPRLRGWFFLRYVDEEGIHLRLRLRVATSEAAAFDRGIYPKLHEMVLGIARLPLEEAPQLVSIQLPQLAHSRFEYGCKRSEYIPETDVYGDGSNVEIAECLFQASSEIAVDVICEERNGAVSRKDLAPALMKAALEEFKINRPAIDFLSDYIAYWTSFFPSKDNYIATFENKHRELVGSRIPIIRPDNQYNPLLSAALQKWRKSLRETQSAYKKNGQYSDGLAERLLFSFIHLMNNRLGFSLLDEIYLAVLLNGETKDKKIV